MAVEIERKFLVTDFSFKEKATSSYKIKQGFLNTHKDRTVRVRTTGEKGYLTVKGKSTKNGLVRFEWETEIKISDAENLLLLCEDRIIEKTRFEVVVGNHRFEIDTFEAKNEGLVIAELELTTEDESYPKPKWLGEEVTGEVKYYNSQLALKPYKEW